MFLGAADYGGTHSVEAFAPSFVWTDMGVYVGRFDRNLRDLIRLGDWQALENVIHVVVIVPVLLAPTMEAYRHFNTLPYLNRVSVDGEGKLIGETVAGVFHVTGLEVREAAPAICAVPHID